MPPSRWTTAVTFPPAFVNVTSLTFSEGGVGSFSAPATLEVTTLPVSGSSRATRPLAWLAR